MPACCDCREPPHTRADGRLSAKASAQTRHPSRKRHGHTFSIHAARRESPARLAAFLNCRQSLDQALEIVSWPLAECDPPRLSLQVQVIRIVIKIAGKAFLDGSLAREAARERDRERILEELTRREFGAGEEA
jgi:hypothetical protein